MGGLTRRRESPYPSRLVPSAAQAAKLEKAHSMNKLVRFLAVFGVGLVAMVIGYLVISGRIGF